MDNQFSTQASNYFDLQGLEQLRKKTKTNDEQTIREVANQFESMFASMLIKSMRDANAAFESDSPFNSQQTKFYTDMQDKQLALDMSQSGALGLADALVRQLDPRSAIRPSSVSQDQLTMPDQEQAQMWQLNPEQQLKEFNKPDQMQPSQVKAAELVSVDNQQREKTDFSSPSSFIQTLLPYAKKAAKVLGISPEVMIAQSALETGWGKKILQKADQQSSFNLFNIKSHKSWQGESVNKSSLEVEEGINVFRRSNFRVYQNLQESFEDYTHFILNNKRYENALQQGENADRYIEELHAAGYATDPHYAEKIKKIMNSEQFQSAMKGDING